MNETDFFQEMILCLSESKLSTCSSLFQGKPAASELLMGYAVLQALSSRFFIPLHFMEVTLRNKIHAALLQVYSTKDMKRRIRDHFGEDKEPSLWYTWMPSKEDTKKNITNAMEYAEKNAAISGRTPTCGDVISELTLGTWIKILGEYMDIKHKLFYWDKAVDLIFPNRCHMRRRGILQQLSEVNIMRNRLFHHEPIWKAKGVSTFEEAVKKLWEQLWLIHDVIAWMSPAMWMFIEKVIDKEFFDEAYTKGTLPFKSTTLKSEGDV